MIQTSSMPEKEDPVWKPTSEGEEDSEATVGDREDTVEALAETTKPAPTYSKGSNTPSNNNNHHHTLPKEISSVIVVDGKRPPSPGFNDMRPRK